MSVFVGGLRIVMFSPVKLAERRKEKKKERTDLKIH